MAPPRSSYSSTEIRIELEFGNVGLSMLTQGNFLAPEPRPRPRLQLFSCVQCGGFVEVLTNVRREAINIIFLEAKASTSTNLAMIHLLHFLNVIDLFSLYVLFSHFRPRDATLGSSFFQRSSYARANVRINYEETKGKFP